MKGKRKNILHKILLLFCSLLACFLMLEVFLRIYPHELAGYKDKYRHHYNPLIGTMTPVPNQRNKVFLNPQIKIYGLSTNSWEMRDYKERSLKKDRFRIAVLGDSFMEAKHVENGKYMAALMEDLFEHRVEVLNFGVERISTVEEYLMYIPKVRKFSPDIVLLSVLPCNDFSENVEQVHTACVGDRNKKRFAYTDSQGTINFTEFPTSRIRKESS